VEEEEQRFGKRPRREEPYERSRPPSDRLYRALDSSRSDDRMRRNDDRRRSSGHNDDRSRSPMKFERRPPGPIINDARHRDERYREERRSSLGTSSNGDRHPGGGPIVNDDRDRRPSGPIVNDARDRRPSGPIINDARDYQ